MLVVFELVFPEVAGAFGGDGEAFPVHKVAIEDFGLGGFLDFFAFHELETGGEDFGHDAIEAPTVEKGVVFDEGELEAVVAEDLDGVADEGRMLEIERGIDVVLVHEPDLFFLSVCVEMAKVVPGEFHLGLGMDELEGLTVGVHVERGTQGRMARNNHLNGFAEGAFLDVSFEEAAVHVEIGLEFAFGLHVENHAELGLGHGIGVDHIRGHESACAVINEFEIGNGIE